MSLQGENKMKFNFINKKAIEKLKQKGQFFLLAGIVSTTLSACYREVSTNSNVKYDVIDTSNEDLVTSGVQQVLSVPGEDFKLVVNYRCILEDGAKWTVTSDKEMYMDICADGLNPNTKVYIDNVHIDTTIRSIYPTVDGITQDTMDDRIHNSLMLGFPISDTNIYSSVNCIEGQNQSFTQGSFYGFNGYYSGTIQQKRYLESDYLSSGVYANKINSIIDLIIVNPDNTTRCVSVPSTIEVSVWPYIEKVNSSGESSYTYYYFDNKTGSVEKESLNSIEYESKIQKSKKLR